MIPQGLIITLTLTMILGVIKMYNQRILVQRASAVETLAGIKVLCMDKTGTITQNKLKMSNTELLTSLGIRLAYSALSAQKDKNKTGKVIEGFLSKQFAKEDLADGQQVVGEVTSEVLFNSRNKYSGSVVRLEGKSYQVVFGGVDVLAALVRKEELGELQGYDTQYADLGQRNLCMLYRELKASEPLKSDEQLADGGDWIGAALGVTGQNQGGGSFNVGGFFSITDQLRKGAKKILESFQAQNIKPVIISGDGPSTLAAIIKNLGVKGMDKIVTGSEIAAIDPNHEQELAELIIGADVFARVTAEQKLTIVRAYQKHIGRAAMVGDGVNDALALKEADLGVSLGSGVNIAKNVADVVLLDDDLLKLSGVITEGRGIIYDMLRSSQILLIKNVYALVMILFSLALFLPFPFNFRGLFMLSLVNNNIPILFILLSRGSHGGKRYNYMHELVTFALSGGLISGAMGLAALILLTPVMEVPELQSFILSFFVAVGIINSMIVFNRSYNPLKVLFGSWYFLAAIFNLAIYLVLLVVPFAIDIFQIKMPSLDSWLLIGLMSIGYLLAFAIMGPIVKGFAPLRKYLLSLGE
jgi:cation-transporting ATPase E